MLAKLKTQFYSLLKGLGYNVTDNAEYREDFPWLMVRTNGYQSVNSFNLNVSGVTLALDIFSTYPGEKEIIEIVENIGSHLDELRKANPEILFCYQKTMKILDDKPTGPVRKHGVVVYEFLMGYGVAPVEEVPEIEPEN